VTVPDHLHDPVDDRYSLLVALGSLLVFSSCWQLGFFIADSYTVANGLVNVASGRLEVTHIQYSLTLQSQPGLRSVDGKVYARNYGQLFAAVPVLWALRGLSEVVDPALLIAGGWSLLALAFCWQLGVVVDRPVAGSAGGAVVALGVLSVNAVAATAVETRWLPLLALQLLGVLVAATIPVVLYRLLATYHGRTVGLAVAVVSVLASPIWFWAPIPKRHVITAAVTVVALAGFAAHRRTGTLWLRVLPYLAVAFLTWVHAFEGFLLLLALVPVDVATADSNAPRAIAIVGLVFVLALGPFFLTNVAVTGSPITSPRMAGDGLSSVGVGPAGTVADESTPTSETTRTPRAGAADHTSTTASASPTSRSRADSDDRSIVGRGLAVVLTAGSYATGGLRVALLEPDRVWRTFVRSGRLEQGPQYRVTDHETVDLSILEAMPVFGTVLAVPVLLRRRLDTASLRDWQMLRRLDERHQTDLLAATIVVVFSVFYLPTLPLVSQITVRYLLSVFPLGIYGIARLPAVRSVLDERPRWALGSYLSSLAVGGPVLLGLVAVLGLAVGEAMQFHALVNLTTATVAAITVIVQTLGYEVDARLGAVALASPVAAATTLVVAMQLEYFAYGRFVLPGVRYVADLVVIVS